jgi:hypothetical protein
MVEQSQLTRQLKIAAKSRQFNQTATEGVITSKD